MTETVIVTGLTGRTGKCFLDRLQAAPPENMRFIAIVRESSDIRQIQQSSLGIQMRTGDLKDAEFLTEAMKGGDVLLHIAGIHDSRLVMKAAAEQGIRRWIAVHTTGIYSQYKSAGAEYLETDAIVEELARQCGARLTILRPTMIYGGTDDQNVCKFIAMVDRFPWMPVVGGGRYPLQPVHREDLADAYYAVLTHPEATDGKQYVLSGEKPILLREMLALIGSCLHKRVRFAYVPYFLAYTAALLLYGISLKRIDYREKVQRLVEPRAYPHWEAQRDFGFRPRPFSDGIRREVAEYLKQKAERNGSGS